MQTATTAAYPEHPGAKVAGTSQEAADAASVTAKFLREQCYALLQRQNLTADECAVLMGKSILSIRPRFSELATSNRIFDTGIRRTNNSGRAATVWTAQAQGMLF